MNSTPGTRDSQAEPSTVPSEEMRAQAQRGRWRRVIRPLLLALLVTAVAAGCVRQPAPDLRPAAGDPFTVTHDPGTNVYHATSASASYTGSLKQVVESAVYDLDSAGGGTITFTEDTFDFGGEWLELYHINLVEFVGQGPGLTVLKNNSSEATDTEVFDCVDCDHITIRDMTVEAGGPARSTSDAMDFDFSEHVLIENVHVNGSRGRGIVFDGKNSNYGNADHNTIRNCEISGVPRHGIEMLASSFNTVENCHVHDVGGIGIYANKASSSSTPPNKPSNGNTILNNLVERTGNDGIRLNSGNNNTVDGNTVKNSGQTVSSRSGIRVISYNQQPCDDNVLQYNTAADDQTPATQLYGLDITSAECNRTVIRDNAFSGNNNGEIRDNGTDTIYDNTSETQPPTVPANLTATASGPNRVDLSWSPSTDNVGVTSYEIERDGVSLATIGNQTNYSDTTVQPDITYEYRVRAGDAAGNWSGWSNLASVTPLNTSTFTFVAEADAYVREDKPGNNYGGASDLRVDGSPNQQVLLKFLVSGVAGLQIDDVKLRLYNVNASGDGGQFYKAAHSSWSENGVNWTNAPATGALLGSLGSVHAGNWYEVDVDGLVVGDGYVTVRASSTNGNGAYYASKEGGNAPQLVVSTSGNGGGNAPPIADPQAVTAQQDTPLAITLTGTDTDGDCPLTFTVVDAPANGAISAPSGETCAAGAGSAQVTYTPTGGFSGADSFTFSVTDPHTGTSLPATVSITVTPAPVTELTFAPVADTYVRENRPTTNYGNSSDLRADASPIQQMLLKFDVSGVGTQTVTAVKLRLYNVNASNDGGGFFEAVNSTWTETGVTWTNAPPVGGPQFGSLGSVQAGNWYEVDLTGILTGDGLVSIRVTSSSANGAYYSSKEGSNPPELVVTVE